MNGPRNDWCKDLLRQYDTDLKLLQGMLLNQMQNNQRMPNQHEFDNQALVQELIKKKGKVDQLEKENRDLAQEFLKSKNEPKDSKPVVVLQEMVKEKNQVFLI
jgi:hypothetical protein